MSECLFPMCKRHAQPNGYCIGHRIYSDCVIPVIPEPIQKESGKMKSVKSELKKLYPIFLQKHKTCQLKTPVCTKKATCIHHTKGRGPNEIKDESTWKASCTACNLWVEQNHAAAEERGLKVPRHQKQKNV